MGDTRVVTGVGSPFFELVPRGEPTPVDFYTRGWTPPVDCAHSSAELIYATSGKPVPPVTPPENDGVRATLVLSGSTWKVSKQTVTEGTCAPGS